MSFSRKFLYFAVLLMLILAVAALWWRIDGERMPDVEVSAAVELPDPNAFDLLVEAVGAMSDPQAVAGASRGIRYDSETGKPEEIGVSEKEEIVADNEEALALLREALQYPLVYPEQNEFFLFPGRGEFHIGNVRTLSSVLALESAVHRERGRFGAAMQSALDCMELGRLIGNRFPVLGTLTGIAITGIGFQDVPKILPELGQEELEEAQVRMAGIADMSFEMAAILEAERDLGITLLKSLFAEEDWRINLAKRTEVERMDPERQPEGLFREIEINDFPISNRVFIILRSWRYHKGRMVSAYEEMMGQVKDAARTPFPSSENRFPGQDLRLPPLMDDGRPLRRVWFSVLVDETLLEMLQAKIALSLWHKEHDTYPASLQALDGNYLARLPEDPFAEGDPLLYRVEGDAYILYSVGPNGRDDGGKPMERPNEPEERRYIPQYGLSGDIVASVNFFRRAE